MPEYHSIRLKQETIERLRAACATLRITTVDQLAERIILESLPTIEHEDLMFIDEAQVFDDAKFAAARAYAKGDR